MIHQIFPHRFNNTYLPDTTAGDDDIVLLYNENSLLLKTGYDGIAFPRKRDIPELTSEIETVFLFTLDDVPCFLVPDTLNVQTPGLAYMNLGFFRTEKKREIAWTGITGYHLKTWYAQNCFCGKCGTRNLRKSDERALSCPECGTVVYPRISPAVIVAILCRGRILLARNSNFPGNWYSLIAGYVDVGESLEEAVVREVKEEVGLDVWNIRYYRSQPWPVSGSMMIGFVAEADDSQPLLVDGKEIAEAAWFTGGTLPEYPPNISISGEMIEKFVNGKL